MPLSAAVRTSLLVVGASSATGVIARLRTRQVQWRLAAVFGLAGAVTAFAATAVAGSLVAGRFAARVPAGRLRRWFAYLVFLVAALVLVQLAISPSAIAAG